MTLSERIAEKARELYGCASICGKESDALIMTPAELVVLITAEMEAEIHEAAKKKMEAFTEILCDLLAQWRETRMLYNSDPSMHALADGYTECIGELNAVLNGDLSPIKRIHQENEWPTGRQYTANDIVTLNGVPGKLIDESE